MCNIQLEFNTKAEKEAFLNGYELAKMMFKRPYGKWIRQSESRTIFFCSKCGREINTTPFTRTDKFPYCHCGADMRPREGEAE